MRENVNPVVFEAPGCVCVCVLSLWLTDSCESSVGVFVIPC